MENRWQDIFNKLSSSDFDVYSPGTKVGECSSKYLVVKKGGSSQVGNFSSTKDLYEVMCYVPQQSYSSLETFIQEVKAVMKELAPMVYPTGEQTPSFYDDTIKAHMVSIVYRNYKKD